MGLRPNTLSCRALLLLIEYSHLCLYKGSLLYYIIHIIQYTNFQSLTIYIYILNEHNYFEGLVTIEDLKNVILLLSNVL
jgi:hypothetical protein